MSTLQDNVMNHTHMAV